MNNTVHETIINTCHVIYEQHDTNGKEWTQYIAHSNIDNNCLSVLPISLPYISPHRKLWAFAPPTTS